MADIIYYYLNKNIQIFLLCKITMDRGLYQPVGHAKRQRAMCRKHESLIHLDFHHKLDLFLANGS